MLSLATIDQIAAQAQEPETLLKDRHQAFATHQDLPWPHASDDVWRRTDVALLDPVARFHAANGSTLKLNARAQGVLSDALTQALGNERLLVRLPGQWLHSQLPKEVSLRSIAEVAQQDAAYVQSLMSAQDLTHAEQKLATLNTAFHQDGMVLRVPKDFVDTTPWRFVHLFPAVANQVSFPRLVVHLGSHSSLTLIDEYADVYAAGSTPGHLVHGRIELVLEPGARLHYVRLQRWGKQTREFLLQRATLGRDATLTMANLTLGAALSKAHIITRLTGEQASSRLYGFVFGQDKQHIDQHTLQDHQAPHTFSNLNYRAALQDESHMVYTGLIRIAKQARQTEAFQENHNLLLSPKAKADTIPMLEILADDVQCKHAAAVGPIDEDQVFYLTSRGIHRQQAERLIVMGFIEPLIQQVPFTPLQERLRYEFEEGLHY